jgi:hypothetical protein
VGLGSDKPPSAEHPPDGGQRRDRGALLAQVVVDGRRPGVQPAVGELLAQDDDPVLDLGAGPVRDPM